MKRAALLLMPVFFGCPMQTEEPPIEMRTDPIVATSSSSVEYRVSFEDRSAHYMDVEGVFLTDGRETLALSMPVWTPGSYKIRDFSRNVEGLTARSENGLLAVKKTRKNRYEITLDRSERVAVRYRVYARAPNVRASFVDTDHAVINGAPTFFQDVGRPEASYRLRLALPKTWKTAVSGLRSSSAPDGATELVAPTYDVLVDSPIVAGSPVIHRFELEGVEHLLVNTDEGEEWDGPRSARDVERITKAIVELWGVIPYDRYVYLNVINGYRGGLEHKNSTLMMTTRWKTKNEEDYRGWLSLVSHEFFHTWNGKRLRPVMLGPFDYEREVYTQDLWIVEGLTSYYDDLMLVRAGLMTEDQYLGVLSKAIKRVQTAPGRRRHSLAEASYDAWIKFYQWDENSNNTTISYYTKGALVGFLLDALIRDQTNESKSLDDVMRQAYAEFSAERGYTSDDFYAVVEHFAGRSVREQLVHMVETTEELDYAIALDFYGLELEPPKPKKKDERPKAHLGVHTDKRVITEVVHGEPAHAAGLNVEDELIAIDGHRIERLKTHLERYRAGDAVVLTIARRGRLMALPVKLGARDARTWKLRTQPKRTFTQIRRFERLLSR